MEGSTYHQQTTDFLAQQDTDFPALQQDGMQYLNHNRWHSRTLGHANDIATEKSLRKKELLNSKYIQGGANSRNSLKMKKEHVMIIPVYKQLDR